MALKKSEKTALVKLLSAFIQADGAVNRNELSYLNYLVRTLDISLTEIKSSATLTFEEAIRVLQKSHYDDRIAILKMVQQMSLSDKDLSEEERIMMVILFILLQIDDSISGRLRADVISIKSGKARTRREVVYLEATENPTANASIRQTYEQIETFFTDHGFEFIYLPYIIGQLKSKQVFFRELLSYIDPVLSEDQLASIPAALDRYDTVGFTRDLFLNEFLRDPKMLDSPAFLFPLPFRDGDLMRDYFILHLPEAVSPSEVLQIFFNLFKQVPQFDFRTRDNHSDEEVNQYDLHHAILPEAEIGRASWRERVLRLV